MKRLFFILFSFFVLATHAQYKKIEDARKAFWGPGDKYKKANQIPDKWKGESAVVIYKNINYAYHNRGKMIYWESSIRQRVKILDKNALKEFSEFNYSATSNFKFRGKKHIKHVGIKVIKPDGNEIVIDVEKESVTKDDEVKVAVPNLEVGDIIDYFFYNFVPIYTFDAIYYFDPVEVTLNEEYPIMNLDFFLETEDDFFINFVSINGAPKLKKIRSTHKKYRNYQFSSSDIEKSDYPIWFYPMQELPGFKMQIYFIKKISDVKRANVFISEKESIIKDHVTKEEILKFYNKRLVKATKISDVKAYLKKHHFKNNEEKIRAVYNYLRYKHVMKWAIYVVNKELELFDNEMYKLSDLYYYDKVDFVREFSLILNELKIPHEVAVGIYRYDGKLSNLIIEDNVRFVIVTKTEKPLYISYFDNLSTVSYINPYLEGTDVYLMSSDGVGGKTMSKRKLTKIKDGKLPVSNYQDNLAYKKVEVSLKDNFEGFNVKIHAKMNGHAKHSEQADKLLFSDYLYDDIKLYRNEPFTRKIKMFSPRSKFKKKIQSVFDKFKKKRKEELEEGIKSEFKLNEKVKDYDFKFITLGRNNPNEPFEFEESFSFDNQYIKKAGRNYIIEIGKFIGGQITIDDADKDRKENIYMKYPRVFNYDIVFTIPEGYQVKGLEKLNKKVENETGGFTSTAKIEGNKLIISTSKQYKKNYYPNAQWKDILAFLEEAIQFTNEKVLLKKK